MLTGGGVKSYPNIQVDPNTPLSQMKSATAYFSIGSPGGGWGKEIYSNQTIGASTFSQIWQVNHGHNILMLFRNQQRTSGYEDLLAIMNWCNSHHLLSNSTFASFPFGVEVTSTSGWQTFDVWGYSASWSNIHGGGSGI